MLQYIKGKLKQLQKENTIIQIQIKDKTRSSKYHSCEVKIIELYHSIFVVEEQNKQNPKRFSIQYVELITRDVIIKEVGQFPEKPKLK